MRLDRVGCLPCVCFSVLVFLRSVQLNRPKATKVREKAVQLALAGSPIDADMQLACLKKSVFGQLYRQVHFQVDGGKSLRCSPEGKPFSVKYDGEAGIDAGGLFRDCLSAVCSELQSTVPLASLVASTDAAVPAPVASTAVPVVGRLDTFSFLPLLVPVANARVGVGLNQDKFLPNPRCSSQLHLSMYAFIGKLMGLAIRGHHMLNLDLPSLVWKRLIAGSDASGSRSGSSSSSSCSLETGSSSKSGDTGATAVVSAAVEAVAESASVITRQDLESIDSLCMTALAKLAKCDEDGFDDTVAGDDDDDDDDDYDGSEEDAPAERQTFTTLSIDGRIVELIPDGSNVLVTAKNRFDFIARVEQYKRDECALQIDAMRAGLGTVVPLSHLSMFSASELELMVCGQREIDVDYLQQNTELSGFRPRDKYIEVRA
jgi:hypothetical protein